MTTIKLVTMAYLKPPWFTAKVFNRFAMATGMGNIETLAVIRRGSREPQKIPVVAPDVNGVQYLVSPRSEPDWVKNALADPHVTLGGIAYVATELPVDQRAPVIAAYRPMAGKVVESYWRQLPDDADHPVFSLTPTA